MKQLLFSITKKDFIVETFRGSGNGGQKRQKTSNCVRITHIESGAVGTGKEERSLEQNKKNAFKRLVDSKTFKVWLKVKTASVMKGFADIEQMINKQVDQEMQDKNLKIEFYEPKNKDKDSSS